VNAKLEIAHKFHVIGWARGTRITMDGVELARIANGKTATVEVPPGKHVLTAWLGGNPSAENTIDFASGETVHVECKMKMGWFSSGYELTSRDATLVAGTPVTAGHHGTMILVFGILGFFIGIFGLVALIQGIVDLTKMSRGQMDRSGELLTWIGLVLGTIGFLVNVLLIVIMAALGQHP
jgi:hypothetical protein